MQALVAISKQEAVKAAVDEVVAALAPHVIYIRHEFSDDWSGEPAIYFRVLLTDEASREENLHPIAQQVRLMLDDRLDLREMGYSYVRFRSFSEQQMIKESEWY